MKTKIFLSLLLLATVVPVHLRLLIKPRRRLTVESDMEASSLVDLVRMADKPKLSPGT